METKILIVIDAVMFGANAWDRITNNHRTEEDELWACCLGASAVINIIATLFI